MYEFNPCRGCPPGSLPGKGFIKKEREGKENEDIIFSADGGREIKRKRTVAGTPEVRQLNKYAFALMGCMARLKEILEENESDA